MRIGVTEEILQAVRRSEFCMTATRIAKEIDHDPAIVSGILARLHKTGRVFRGNDQIADPPGPWRYAHYRARLEGEGLISQAADDRPWGDE
jgi:predicted transcriptional regulator